MNRSQFLAALVISPLALASVPAHAESTAPATAPQPCVNPDAAQATVPKRGDQFAGVWQETEFAWWSIWWDGADLVGTTDYCINGVRTRHAKLLFEPAKLTGERVGLFSVSESNRKIVLKPVADGSALMGYIYLQNSTVPLSLRKSTQLGAPANYRSVDELLGAMQTIWTTPLGTLTIIKGTNELRGTIRNAQGDIIYRLWDGQIWAHGTPYDDRMTWRWEKADRTSAGMLYTSLSPDGKTFIAGNFSSAIISDLQTWTAVRYGSAGTSTGNTSTGAGGASNDNGPASGGSGEQPSPQAPVPQGDGSFKPLGKYSIRLDRVVPGKGSDIRTHVFLTLKNASQQKLYVTSGQLLVRVTDGNGVNKENGQVLQPVEFGLKLFESTPVLDPADELKVQYAIVTERGSSTSRVTVMEGDKRTSF
jgi:hypothetical protein